MKKALKQSTISTLLNVLTMLMIIAVSLSFLMVVYTNNKVDIANKNRYNLTHSANQFMNASAYLTSEVRSYVATGNDENFNNYWNEVNNLKNRDIAVSEMERIGITDRERQEIEAMSNLSNYLVPLEDQAMQAIKIGDYDSAMDLVFGSEYEKNIKQIRQHQTDFLNMLETRTLENVMDIESSINKFEIISLLIVILLILVQVLSTFLNRMLIIKPIIKLKDEMIELSEGRFDTNFALEPDTSEIGSLIFSVYKVKGTIHSLVEGLKDVSGELKQGDIDARISEADFKGEYGSAVKAINAIIDDYIDEILTMLTAYGEFGKGNFDVVLRQYPGKKSVANEKFDMLKHNLKSVSSELSSLISLATNGKIDKKVEASLYKGDWKKLMEGLNTLLQAISDPINEANFMLEKLSEGDFSVSVSKNYKGSFAHMMDSFDYMISTTGSYISEITSILGLIADGDLSVTIERTYVGEFNLIKQSINNIIKTLNATMANIKTSAESVFTRANQISQTAMDIANGASTQASTVEELSASITLINEKALKTSQDAHAANEISSYSIISAKKGSQEMQDMLSAMNDIKEASRNISKVVKDIDDIAFQTNLLATNAAIEAARAGADGKGFSIVASEVRLLSAQSSQSAKDTSDLIDDAIRKIDDGMNKAKATSDSFDEIVSGIDTISETIGYIYSATNEQSNNISQMSTGIHQISQVVQDNSSTSQESAAAAEELNSMAGSLNELVSKFKLQ